MSEDPRQKVVRFLLDDKLRAKVNTCFEELLIYPDSMYAIENYDKALRNHAKHFGRYTLAQEMSELEKNNNLDFKNYEAATIRIVNSFRRGKNKNEVVE